MNVQCRIIAFREDKLAPLEIYFLNDEILPQIGNFVYNRKLGAFAAIQKVLHKDQLNNEYPLVVATTNPKYSEIKRVPPAFEKAYRDNEIKPSFAPLRI